MASRLPITLPFEGPLLGAMPSRFFADRLKSC